MWLFFKDFIVYGFASVLGKMAAIFLIPLYTSVLTKEEYGAMALITACKGIIDLFSNLNIHSGIARDYYEVGEDKKRLVSTGLFSILTCGFFVFIVVFSLSNFITDKVLAISKYYWPFVFMALSIPTGSVMSYFSILTRFKKKPKIYALGSMIQLVIQIAISAVGVAVYKYGIISVFVGVLLGELFIIIFFGIINKEYISFIFKWEYLKRALIFSIPTLPAILAGWVDSSAGLIITGRFISIEELGVYSLALQLASVFTLVSTAFQNVWSPFLYENYKKNTFQSDIVNLFSVFVFILVLLTLALSLFSKEVILLLSNSSYLNASKYFSLLCIPMAIYMLFPFASSGVSITRNTKHIGFSYVAGSFFNVISIYILIPVIGVYCIPVSLAFSRIITFSYLYIVSKKQQGINLPVGLILIILTISATCFIMQYLNVNLMTRIFILFVASFVILIIFNRFIDYSNIKLFVKAKIVK